MSNNTLDDCIWRRGNDKDSCPDPEVRVILYTGSGSTQTRQVLDMTHADWLRNSAWNPNNDNIILIHGYAGGDDILPIVVLKDGNQFNYLLTCARHNINSAFIVINIKNNL